MSTLKMENAIPGILVVSTRLKHLLVRQNLSIYIICILIFMQAEQLPWWWRHYVPKHWNASMWTISLECWLIRQNWITSLLGELNSTGSACSSGNVIRSFLSGVPGPPKSLRPFFSSFSFTPLRNLTARLYGVVTVSSAVVLHVGFIGIAWSVKEIPPLAASVQFFVLEYCWFAAKRTPLHGVRTSVTWSNGFINCRNKLNLLYSLQ